MLSEGKRRSVLIIDDDQEYLEIMKIGLGDEFDVLNIGDFRVSQAEICELRPSVIMIKNLRESRVEDINFIQSLSSFEIPILVLENDIGANLRSESNFKAYKVKSHSFQEIRDRIYSILNGSSDQL